MTPHKIENFKRSRLKLLRLIAVLLLTILYHDSQAQVALEYQVLIADSALYFDGVQQTGSNPPNTQGQYDFRFGRFISAHGDCIKTMGKYVFMTWYKGGKFDRHVRLTRYDTETGVLKTIEFPHTHTGYLNQWWIGESHNTIAIGVSPLDGTIHLIYDMHAYSDTRPSDGSLSDDYFRYSYSVQGAATVPDSSFTLNQFVQSPNGDYKHISLAGDENNRNEDYPNLSGLTYPKFFLNDCNELLMYIREGGNNNAAYKFSKYDHSTGDWSGFTGFNVLNAKSRGEPFNWGLYGSIKYVNGKIRIGFQQRSSNNNDKYLYQNGFYYAYSDDQNGQNNWKDYQGNGFNLPLLDPDMIKIAEPGDYVSTTLQNKVRIVSGFDWTVTQAGDVHFIGRVKDDENNVITYVHSYQSGGTGDFVSTTDFSGGEAIYTAGNNVYLIGLNSSGRVKVEKAPGGTNAFTTVYEATSGDQFTHGRIHIADGKLYYYLMKKVSTGSARPLYLQVINLDIQPTSEEILSGIYRFKNVASGEYMESDGYEVTLSPSSGGIAKEWRIVHVEGEYYNIESEVNDRGVLRAAPDSTIINTSFASPIADTDKLWKAISLCGNAYRFESKVPDRDYLMAEEPSGNVLWGQSLGDDTRWVLEDVLALSIAPTEESQYTIHPNPAKTFVQIENIKDFQTLRLIDLSGREVLQQAFPSGVSEWKLSVESLSPGMYHLQLIGEKSLVSKKLIIE